jgi:hypothetical protein
MGKAICASLLILLLTCPAQAGFMPNGTPEPPPSQPACAPDEGIMTYESSTSSQPTGAVAETASLTWVTLELLAVLPSLL